MTTQKQIRDCFWQGSEHLRHYVRSKTQNEYSAVIRQEFVEFVDMLARDGHLSESLANRVTL